MPKNVTYGLLFTCMLSSLLYATSMENGVTAPIKVYIVMQSALVPESPYQSDSEPRHCVINIPSTGHEYIMDAREQNKTDAPLTKFFLLLSRFCNSWNSKGKRD